MPNEIKTVTLVDKDGVHTEVHVDSLPEDHPVKGELDRLNQSAGLKVNGKVVLQQPK